MTGICWGGMGILLGGICPWQGMEPIWLGIICMGACIIHIQRMMGHRQDIPCIIGHGMPYIPCIPCMGIIPCDGIGIGMGMGMGCAGIMPGKGYGLLLGFMGV